MSNISLSGIEAVLGIDEDILADFLRTQVIDQNQVDLSLRHGEEEEKAYHDPTSTTSPSLEETQVFPSPNQSEAVQSPHYLGGQGKVKHYLIPPPVDAVKDLAVTDPILRWTQNGVTVGDVEYTSTTPFFHSDSFRTRLQWLKNENKHMLEVATLPTTPEDPRRSKWSYDNRV